MVSIFDANTEKSLAKYAEELKKLIKSPDWAMFVKTGAGKERPPVSEDWYYMRAASILRAVYIHGPIGVQKLRMKYGNKKNRGHKPEEFVRGAGKIIRTCLQQLEAIGLIVYKKDDVHKGRIITAKGKSFVDKNAVKQ